MRVHRVIHSRRGVVDYIKRKLFLQLDFRGVTLLSRVWIVSGSGVLAKELNPGSGGGVHRVNISDLPAGVHEVRYWRLGGGGAVPVRKIFVLRYNPNKWLVRRFYGLGGRSYVGNAMPDLKHYAADEDGYALPSACDGDDGLRDDISGGRFLARFLQRVVLRIIPYIAVPIMCATSFGAGMTMYKVPRHSKLMVIWHHAYDPRADTLYYDDIEPHITLEGGGFFDVSIGTTSIPPDTMEFILKSPDETRVTQGYWVRPRGPPGFETGEPVTVVLPSEDHPTTPAYTIPLKVKDPNDRFELTADSIKAALWAYVGGIQIGDTAKDSVMTLTSRTEAIMREKYGSLILNTSETGVDLADADSAKILIKSLRDPRYQKLITLINPRVRAPTTYHDSLNSIIIWGDYYMRGPPFFQIFGPILDTLKPVSSINEPEQGQSHYIVYPNPSFGEFYISFSDSFYFGDYVYIYDFSGRYVNRFLLSTLGRVRLRAVDSFGRPLPSGLYILKPRHGKAKVLIIRR